MMEGEDRGRLDGPPEAMTPKAEPASPGTASGSSQGAEAKAQPDAGFDFNQPTIVSLLYLSSFFLGVTVIIGVVLAYVWKGESHEDWEDSHFQYLINTFWIGLIGGVVSVILMIALIGFLLLPAVMVLVVVRCVLSLVNAQKKAPMPNPGTWLA